MNGRVGGALVQFGCYQHRYSECKGPIYVMLSLNYHVSISVNIPSNTAKITNFHYHITRKRNLPVYDSQYV